MTNSIQLHGIKFQPMLKRFMVWDKGIGKFLEHAGEKVYDLPLLTDLLDTYNVVEIHEDLVIVQSTNLFDEDGEEIFEGSVVRDFDEAIGVVYYDREDGEYRARSSNGDSFELADSSCDLKVLGHILSNPELLEENNE